MLALCSMEDSFHGARKRFTARHPGTFRRPEHPYTSTTPRKVGAGPARKSAIGGEQIVGHVIYHVMSLVVLYAGL